MLETYLFGAKPPSPCCLFFLGRKAIFFSIAQVKTWKQSQGLLTKITQKKIRYLKWEGFLYLKQGCSIGGVGIFKHLGAKTPQMFPLQGFQRMLHSNWRVGPRQLSASGVGGVKVTSWRDHPMTDGYVVHNHGDRFCTLGIGLWDPFQMAVLWLIDGGW